MMGRFTLAVAVVLGTGCSPALQPSAAYGRPPELGAVSPEAQPATRFRLEAPLPADGRFAGTLSGRHIAVGGRPFGIDISAAGQIVVTQQDTHAIARFGLTDWSVADQLSSGHLPADVLLTSDGAEAIVSSFDEGTVHFVDMANGQEVGTVDLGPNAYRIAIDSAEQRVFVSTTGGRVFAIDRATRTVVDSVTLVGGLHGLAIDHASGRLAVSSTAGLVWLLDARTLDIQKTVALSGVPQEVIFVAGATQLAVAREDGGDVALLDATTLATVNSIQFGPRRSIQPFSLAASPDGTVMLVGSALTAEVAVVELPEGRTRRILQIEGMVRRMVFSADGRRAFIAHEGNGVVVVH